MHRLSLEHGVSVETLERTYTPDQLRIFMYWMHKREKERMEHLAYAVARGFAGDS